LFNYIIDLVFLTAEEVSFSGTNLPAFEQNGNSPVVDQLDFTMGVSADESAKAEASDLAILDKRHQAIFHELCVKRTSAKLQIDLIKVSRSVYHTPDGTIALSCTISREYTQKNRVWYWFAFHPYQQEQLQMAKQGFAAFGCGTADTIFLIPFEDVMVLNVMEAVTTDALHLTRCTSFAVNDERTADGHILAAHNEDWVSWVKTGPNWRLGGEGTD
jgi:hypothetical protein